MITHMQNCTVYCYVKMFCVAMIEEKKKKHFNKCLITSLDSDSVHDSKIIRIWKQGYFTCKYILEEKKKKQCVSCNKDNSEIGRAHV